MPSAVDQAREIVLLAALDLLDDVASDFAQTARDRPLGPRLLRRDDQLLELIRGQRDTGRRSRARGSCSIS